MNNSIKIGAKVRFLNEPISGIITSVINTHTVRVGTEDGFDIDIDVKLLVFVDARTDSAMLEKDFVEEEFENIELPHEPKLQLQFLQSNSNAQLIDLVLYNSSSFIVSFVLSHLNQTYSALGDGIVHKGQAKVLTQLSLLEQSKWATEWQIQIIYHPYQQYYYPSINHKFKVNPAKVQKANQPLFPLQLAGYLIELNPIAKIENNPFFETQSTLQQVSFHFHPPSEIDLHADALGLSEMNLHPAEILPKQLAHFKMCLDAAIIHKYPDLVVIHGIGEGVLKEEVYKEAKSRVEVLSIDRANPLKYGSGATKILFNL